MRNILFFTAAIALALTPVSPVWAEPDEDVPADKNTTGTEDDGVDALKVDKALQKEYRRILHKCGLKITDKPKTSKELRVSIVPVSEINEDTLLNFFSAIDVFSKNFMIRSGLKNVVFCNSIHLNGSAAAGVASGNTIYLKADGGSQVIYHELFHVADPQRKNAQWTQLNNKKFAYTGSQFREAKDNRSQREKDKTKDMDFSADFASAYAMSFEWEDRAETFAYMCANLKAFEEKAEKNPILKKKGDLIRRIIKTYTSDMGEKFWETMAESDDESRRKALIERAKNNYKQ